MLNAALKGFARPVATLAAAAVLTLGIGVSAASAATVDATPDSGLAATGSTPVAVTGGGYTANTDYRVGVCSTRTYGVFGIPACGTMTTVRADASGNISTSIAATKVNANVHVRIPFPIGAGQPATFTCAGSAGDDPCAVSVATHGSAPSIVAREAVSFL